MQRAWNWTVIWLLWPVWLSVALLIFFVCLHKSFGGGISRLRYVQHCLWLPQVLLGLR